LHTVYSMQLFELPQGFMNAGASRLLAVSNISWSAARV
jgi:hypothetical protein